MVKSKNCYAIYYFKRKEKIYATTSMKTVISHIDSCLRNMIRGIDKDKSRLTAYCGDVRKSNYRAYSLTYLIDMCIMG